MCMLSSRFGIGDSGRGSVVDYPAVTPVTMRLIAQFPGEYCRRRLVAINYEPDVSLIGGSGSGIGIEGCGATAEDVTVGVDDTKIIPVQHHQDELQSVSLADDIPMEEAKEGKQGGRTPYLNIILLCRCDNGIEARNAV